MVTNLPHLLVWVSISAVIQWLFGALWYGVIFKNSWRKLVGFAEGEKPKNAWFGMITSLIVCFLLSFVLAHVLHWAGTNTFSGGIKIGIICWFGFIAPPLLAQHIFENRRANLFAINGVYWLIVMIIGGAILASFY